MNLDEFEAVEAEADRQFLQARETYEAMPAEDVFKWAFNKGVHFGITLAQGKAHLPNKHGETVAIDLDQLEDSRLSYVNIQVDKDIYRLFYPEERVRTYDARTGEPHDDVLRTKTGRVLSDAEIREWAEEDDG